MSDLCLEVNDLSVEFPLKSGLYQKKETLKAVQNVSFSIEDGTTMGLVGESGCGKTTAGKAILRLYPLAHGSVKFMGNELGNLSDKEMLKYRSKMQMIFQDPMTCLDPRKRVGDIIAEPLLALKLMDRKDAYDQVHEMMELVGLKKDHFQRYPHEFSGGQRQRIGIARALVAKPKFVVCDEPISALDVSIQAQIINMLEDLQAKYNFTYLFISHDLSMVRHISHKVGVMYLGHLIEYAEVDELYNHILHPYTESLMSAVPEPDPIKNKQSKRIILKGDVPSPAHPPKGCPFSTRCSKCMECCMVEKPQLKEVASNHYVACHLYK